MSRSIILPLLALAGIILYGTTRASKPVSDPTSVQMASDRVEIGSDRVDLGPGRDASNRPSVPSQASTPRPPSSPTPPPAPRLRSNEQAEAEEIAPAPAPADSTAADVSSGEGVSMTTGRPPGAEAGMDRTDG